MNKKKWKEGLLTTLDTAIKKDCTTLIRKHAYELNKIHVQTLTPLIEL